MKKIPKKYKSIDKLIKTIFTQEFINNFTAIGKLVNKSKSQELSKNMVELVNKESHQDRVFSSVHVLLEVLGQVNYVQLAEESRKDFDKRNIDVT